MLESAILLHNFLPQNNLISFFRSFSEKKKKKLHVKQYLFRSIGKRFELKKD